MMKTDKLKEIIECSGTIAGVLEEQSSDGFARAIRDAVSMLEKEDDFIDAIEFLHSAASEPKGLKDIYVQSLGIDEWYALLSKLADLTLE